MTEAHICTVWLSELDEEDLFIYELEKTHIFLWFEIYLVSIGVAPNGCGYALWPH